MESKAAAGCAADEPPIDAAFERLVERTCAFLMEQDPVRGSWWGADGDHHGRLPAWSPDALDDEVRRLGRLRDEYAAHDPASLHPCQVTDREQALGRLGVELRARRAQAPCQVHPQAAVEPLVSGLTLHLLPTCLPEPERRLALLRRLESAPAFLREARAHATRPAAVFTEMAILGAENALATLPPALDAMADGGDSTLAGALRRAAGHAMAALAEHGEFLRGQLMPRSDGDYRIGEDELQALLEEEHRLCLRPAQLVALGERLYHHTLREVRAVAARIRPGENWSRLLLALKNEHPDPGDVTAAYEMAVAAARRHVREQELVTLPEDEMMRVLETPGYARTLVPLVSYVPCGHFGGPGRGFLLVTPPDGGDAPARVRANLRGHTRHLLPLRAARDAYPGRHVQASHALGTGRRLRHALASPLYMEGWSSYATVLMRRSGYAPELPVHLLQFRDQLLCACRIVVDIGLHTGQMSYNEAVAFLVRKAKLERPNAVQEVRRCCQRPTQALCCVVGMLLIDETIRECLAAPGPWADRRSVHDAILRIGPVPLALVRRDLGRPPREEAGDLLEELAPPAPRRGRRVPAGL